MKRSSPGNRGFAGGCHGIDSVPNTLGQRIASVPLGRCIITDALLSHLVYIAWGLGTMTMIHSKPDWIARGDERFDVVAKADDSDKPTEQQLLTMLQNLLTERFDMKFHRETVEAPGFALTIAKNGPKLEKTKGEEPDLSFGNGQGKPTGKGSVTIRGRRFSMATLVRVLSIFGGQGQGIDKTGLDGVYDFNLSWNEETGPTLADALREQLGLRLTPQKVEISNFVVDSAQRPSGN